MNHPFLIALSEELKKNIKLSKQIIDGKSDQQLTWNPAANRWSICECFGHLLQTHYEYKPKLTAAIESGQKNGITSNSDYKPSWFGKKFINAVGPEYSLRLKAPRIFRPKQEQQQDIGVCEELIREMDELQQLFKKADGLNLNKNKLPSPVTRLLRFSIGEGLQLQVKHQQRHLNQAIRVAEQTDFPTS